MDEEKRKAREKQTILETVSEYLPFPIRETARKLKRTRDSIERGDELEIFNILGFPQKKKQSEE